MLTTVPLFRSSLMTLSDKLNLRRSDLEHSIHGFSKVEKIANCAACWKSVRTVKSPVNYVIRAQVM